MSEKKPSDKPIVDKPPATTYEEKMYSAFLRAHQDTKGEVAKIAQTVELIAEMLHLRLGEEEGKKFAQADLGGCRRKIYLDEQE